MVRNKLNDEYIILFCGTFVLHCRDRDHIYCGYERFTTHVFIKYFKIGSTVELVIYIKKSN